MPAIAPDSPRAMLRHGLKTGIATMLAYGVALLLGLKFAYWAALSAVIVMQVYVADSMRMCLYRLSGTALGAVIGMVALLLFPHTPVMTALALFMSVAFCAYMTRYSERYRMAAITVCIVILAGTGQDSPLLFSLHRVAEIAVGVGAAFGISVALWPVRAGAVLQARLAERCAQCAELYVTIMDAFLSLQESVAPHLLDTMHLDLLQDRQMLAKVQRHEQRLYHDDTDRLDLLLRTLEQCATHLRAMLEALNGEHGQGYEILMAPELHRLADSTAQTLRRIADGDFPDTSPLASALDSAQTVLRALRSDGATRRFHLQKLIQFFAFYHGAQAMGRVVLRCGQDAAQGKG